MGIGRKKFRRAVVGILSTCLIFAGNGCGDTKEVGQEVPELLEPLDVAQENVYAQYRDVYTMKVMETVVLPRQEELGFPRAGILENVYVYVGKKVEKGDVLAELKDEAGEECERLMQQLEKLREDNAYNYRHLEIDYEIARLSGQDTARLALKLKQTKELADFEEKYLEDLLLEAEKKRGNHQLIAPFSGTVTAIAGEWENWDGMAISENTPFLVLADEDARFLQTDYIGKGEIESCHEYYVLVDGKRYELEYIPRSEEELQVMTAKNEMKTSRYRILDAKSAWLGKNAFVCIVGEYRENVLSLPKNVLYKERRNYYVYVSDGDTLVKTPVEVGVQGNHYV
ncbi:MAG: hypothetical protein K2N63_03075, partial [Lachnospiraceae bacterium]|nr:hypothetical protein [Lachnospiraceae bacterium]